MADNRIGYGFRWPQGGGGPSMPKPIECFVVSGQTFAVNGGGSSLVLSMGDPVTRLASGGVTLCDGAEGGGGAVAPYGIVVGLREYYDSAQGKLVMSTGIPSGIAYGSNLSRQTKVLVVPLDLTQLWEIDCDDAVTATTLAAYQALLHSNANHRLSGATNGGRAIPRLDISTTNTTSTLVWRIEAISPTLENADYSGNYVKLLVKPNVIVGQSAGVAGL